VKYLLFSICLVLGCSQSQSEQNVMALMPQPDADAGWRWDFEPELYTPETLYEYINGEAEHFNDYNFVEMATSSHARMEDEFATLTIDLYDMGNSLNAFGIYSDHRRPGLGFEQIGEEAIVSELNVTFYKGRFFVQVSAGSMEKIVTDAMRALAAELASTIERTPEPEEMGYLPARDQVSHTLKYLPRGLLGQAAFEHAVQAEYTLPSGVCTAFVVMKGDETEAVQAVTQFRENLVRQGQITGFEGAGEGNSITIRTEYHGNISVRAHAGYVVGVVGYAGQSEADALLNTIVTSLP
jgi:hypothetical protein